MPQVILMNELANPLHENFAQEVIAQNGDTKAAYVRTFETRKSASVAVGASRLINRADIRLRVRQIMEERGVTLEHCVGRLKRFISMRNSVGFSALKLGFQLHGAIGENESENDAPVAMEINVNIGNISQ